MNAAQLEQLRLSILRHLDEQDSRFGLIAAVLLQFLRSEGFTVEMDVLNRELEYLADPAKGFVTSPAKGISPEMRGWKITATGRDYRAERGLK